MNRQELIEAAYNCFYRNHAWAKEAFIEGAEWALRQSPWISVADMLPPFGEKVYVYSTVYSRFGEWKTKRYKEPHTELGYPITLDEHGFNTDCAPYYSPNMQITHWRPMPPFPNKEDKQ